MNDDEGCGCLIALLLQIGGTMWVLSTHLGALKSALVALAMTLTTWVLALAGIIPIVGQMLYRRLAMGVIAWVFGVLGVDQNISLTVPRFVNFILKWVLGEAELTGTLASYTHAVGYTLSIGVSVLVVGLIILDMLERR